MKKNEFEANKETIEEQVGQYHDTPGVTIGAKNNFKFQFKFQIQILPNLLQFLPNSTFKELQNFLYNWYDKKLHP
jgi:hypothetical protein